MSEDRKSIPGLMPFECPSCGNEWSMLVTNYAYDDLLEAQEKLLADRDRLQRENEVMKTALEVYAMTNETFPEYGDVAREALK